LLLRAFTGHDVAEPATRQTRFIQIGESAGAELNLAAATLRSAPVSLHGSGGGSVQLKDLQKIPDYYAEVLELAAAGVLSVETELGATQRGGTGLDCPTPFRQAPRAPTARGHAPKVGRLRRAPLLMLEPQEATDGQRHTRPAGSSRNTTSS
ncbi:MAG TPA: hypothetical protein VK092_03540, partial [Deinococcales bacterium]|nr:hypothetical protein [Deinococcales bacterium]